MLGHLRQCRASPLHARRLFHDIRVYQEDKRWPGWQVVVGIETHAQIKSRHKLFSGTLPVSPGREMLYVSR
jgi:aspartyl-tRNA(Asn)/glutamyl-tRNA(Gln) amidotransferase subunit B